MNNRFCRKIFLVAGLFLFTVVLSSYAESRYPNGRIHSVITTSVVAKIRAIIEAGSKAGRHIARFIKVGDSITKSDQESFTQPISPFLCQFICPDYTSESNSWDFTRNLDTYKDSLSSALLYFLADTISDSISSFNRPSSAASVGMYAEWAVNGTPSPLRTEIDSVNPQYAVIMYGANDVGGYGSMLDVLSTYINSVRRIVDSCIASGVVPILTATCPRLDYMEYTQAMSYLVRCLAQQYQIPFIDYYRAMMPLAGYGLRDDGVHPNYFDYNKICWLTSEGLGYGYNMRNLVTLQALNRMYQIATTSITSIDTEPAALEGNGTESAPFVVDTLPFLDVQLTSDSSSTVVYKFTLSDSVNLRTFVTTQDSSEISLQIVNSSNDSIASSTTEPMICQTLYAGTYYIRIQNSGPFFGKYQFVMYNTDDDGTPGDETDIQQTSSKVIRNESDLIIHRNSKIIEIITSTPGELSVTDLRGRCAFVEKISTSNKITRWTARSTGIYILKYKHDKITSKRTVFVQ